MDRTRPADFLLIDLCSETDRLSDTVSQITHYLLTYRSTALIWSKMESLEVIYAAFPQGQCHFLVNADDVEAMPILAGAFGRGGMDRLYDRDQEVEFRSLHRISDELAEFARTLARMADPANNASETERSVAARQILKSVSEAMASAPKGASGASGPPGKGASRGGKGGGKGENESSAG
jgi:hypothetical protein